jgi:hypothetical protein
MNLTALSLKYAQQIRLTTGARVVGRKHVCRRTFILGLIDRTLALEIKIFEEELRVVAEVVK